MKKETAAMAAEEMKVMKKEVNLSLPPLFLSILLFIGIAHAAVHASKNSEENGNGGEGGTQVLEKESPLLQIDPDTPLVFTSEDDRDIDVIVDFDATDEQSANHTQMISTKGADDIDISGFPPPKGLTLLITNETVTTTFNPVHVIMNKEIKPSIIDEIAAVAKESSNGTVIIDVPAPVEQTQLLPTSSSSSTDENGEQQQGEENDGEGEEGEEGEEQDEDSN